MFFRRFLVSIVVLFVASIAVGQEPPAARTEILISATHSPDTNVREAALLELASELGDYGRLSASQAKALIPLLQEPDPDLQIAVINVLGKTDDGNELIVDALAKMVKSADFKIRKAVASALGNLGTSNAVAPLRELLHDPIPGIQVAALSALGSFGVDAVPAIDDLRPLFKHENAWVAEQALSTVGTLGRWGADLGDDLVVLLKSSDEHVRYEAASALGKALKAPADPETGWAALLAGLSEEPEEPEEPEVPEDLRHSAAQALLPLIEDSDEDIRLAAITSLKEIGSVTDQVLAGVIAGLSDPVPAVRRVAVEAINSFGVEGLDARPQIGAMLRDSDRDVRLAALMYLADFGPADSSISSALTDLLQDRNHAVSTAAEDVNVIVRSLLEEQPEIRTASNPQTLSRASDQVVEPKHVTALREDGSAFPVAIGSKTLAIAVASWCPHSHSLVELLRDEEVKRFISDVELIFFVSDEGKKVRSAISEAITSGRLTEVEASTILKAIDTASPGKPYLHDSGWVHSLPGAWYVVDDAAMPNSIPRSYKGDSFEGEPIQYLKDLPSTPDALIEKTFDLYETLIQE